MPVHEFGFCLCPANPKESLGCNVVKPCPPQGLVSTLRCPRCEAPVPLFIHKRYTRTSETSTKLSYCCRGMCQAQIPQKTQKHRSDIDMDGQKVLRDSSSEIWSWYIVALLVSLYGAPTHIEIPNYALINIAPSILPTT